MTVLDVRLLFIVIAVVVSLMIVWLCLFARVWPKNSRERKPPGRHRRQG